MATESNQIEGNVPEPSAEPAGEALMRSGKGPSVRRLLCTEPLEGRWLLSAAAPPPPGHAADGEGEEDGDDNAQVLSSSPSDARADDDEDDHEEGQDEEDADENAAREDEDEAEDEDEDGDADDREDEILETSGVAPAPSGQFSDTQLDDDDDDEEDADELVTESTPAPPDPAPAASSPGAVEVVELQTADEDEADGDVDVPASRLPAAVRAAFDANYPGAKVIEAEYGSDEGEDEYDITARFNGDVIDVTFTPGGEIIETERALTSDELPREVLDWVREHFADAEIDEASVMIEDGVQQYEVLIAAADGTQTEATLRVPGLDTPGSAPGDGDGDNGDGDGDGDGAETPDETPARTVPPESEGAGSSGEGPAGATEPAPEAEARADAGQSAAASVAPNPSESGTAQVPAGPDANANRGISAADTLAAAARAARVAAALQALAAGEPADRWLPQLAGVLGDVFTADAAGVESRLDVILARIDALAEEVGAGGIRDAGGPSRLAMVAALIAASQLYRLHPRRARAGPAVVFNTAAVGTSSWSWVFGKPSDEGRERSL